VACPTKEHREDGRRYARHAARWEARDEARSQSNLVVETSAALYALLGLTCGGVRAIDIDSHKTVFDAAPQPAS